MSMSNDIAIAITKQEQDKFEVAINKDVTINELEIYTARLAYYLAKRWAELKKISLEESAEQVAITIESQINIWESEKHDKKSRVKHVNNTEEIKHKKI